MYQNKPVAEGRTLDGLELALLEMPPGRYIVEVFSNEGEGRQLDVEVKEHDGEGVGIAPLLLAALGIIGLIVGWRIWQAAYSIPDWAWIVGGISCALLLIGPLLSMVSPARKVQAAAQFIPSIMPSPYQYPPNPYIVPR